MAGAAYFNDLMRKLKLPVNASANSEIKKGWEKKPTRNN